MCVRAKSLQSYPTLCDPMGCSPLGSSVQGSCLENPMDRGAWRAAVRGQRVGHDTQLSTVLVHASGGSHSQFHWT